MTVPPGGEQVVDGHNGADVFTAFTGPRALAILPAPAVAAPAAVRAEPDAVGRARVLALEAAGPVVEARGRRAEQVAVHLALRVGDVNERPAPARLEHGHCSLRSQSSVVSHQSSVRKQKETAG